jgi:hypothetical protein
MPPTIEVIHHSFFLPEVLSLQREFEHHLIELIGSEIMRTPIKAISSSLTNDA